MKTLTGSEKQIAWAEKIRMNAIKALNETENFLKKQIAHNPANAVKMVEFNQFRDEILNENLSTWFINNRDMFSMTFFPWLLK